MLNWSRDKQIYEKMFQNDKKYTMIYLMNKFAEQELRETIDRIESIEGEIRSQIEQLG